VDKGYMDNVPIAKIGAFEQGLHAHFANTKSDVIAKINDTGDWNDELETAFKTGIEEFVKTGSW
jgi:F-type H+-transporting ATPase subunit alpha